MGQPQTASPYPEGTTFLTVWTGPDGQTLGTGDRAPAGATGGEVTATLPNGDTESTIFTA